MPKGLREPEDRELPEGSTFTGAADAELWR